MDTLHIDLLVYLMGFLGQEHLRIFRCCCRRFRAIGGQELQRRDQAARQRFLKITQTEKDLERLVLAAIRENQFSFDWEQLSKTIPRIKNVLILNHFTSIDIIFYVISKCGQTYYVEDKMYNLDLPYSQYLHNFIKESTWHWNTIEYMCFRLTKVKYIQAAYHHANRMFEAQTKYHRNVYVTKRMHTCKYNALSAFHKHLPQFYYQKLPELDLSQRHWAALCVQDVRYRVGSDKYFKTWQEVIDYYQAYITNSNERKWVKRKLQGYQLVFIW